MRRSIPRSASHRLSLISPSRIATSQPLPPPSPPPRALLHLRPTPPPARPKTPRTTNHQAITIPRRTFFNLPDLSSILPTNNQNNNNNDNNRTRTLTATRTLPYPPAPLFDVVASVESYSQFLPFLTASTVTARDPKTSYPTRAFLTIGYGPLSETFTSRVDCDPAALTVEARSGAKFGVDSKQDQEGAEFPGSREGIFDYLSTRWELVPEKQGRAAAPWTRVQLRIQFEFRSQFHAAVMSAVEGQMAGVMVEAFEKRMREAQR